MDERRTIRPERCGDGELKVGQVSRFGVFNAIRGGKFPEIRVLRRDGDRCDLRRGLPTEIILGPADIAEAMAEPLEEIAYGIQRTLERMPPELASDIVERGICLTGGGSLLDKIDLELSRKIGVRMIIPDEPRNSVVIGCGMILKDLAKYRDFLIRP